MQAYVERWVQSLKQECLDWFIAFVKQHFDYLIDEYVEHYLTERPHQALGNVPLTGDWPDSPESDSEPESIICHPRLGGVLKSYTRSAA